MVLLIIIQSAESWNFKVAIQNVRYDVTLKLVYTVFDI